MQQIPKPRIGIYYGMPIHNSKGAMGTWLEGEEFSYASKTGQAMLRRAYCLDSTGALRVVRCCIPDTWFSIPAVATIKGARVKGYIYSEDYGVSNCIYRFHAYGEDTPKPATHPIEAQ